MEDYTTWITYQQYRGYYQIFNKSGTELPRDVLILSQVMEGLNAIINQNSERMILRYLSNMINPKNYSKETFALFSNFWFNFSRNFSSSNGALYGTAIYGLDTYGAGRHNPTNYPLMQLILSYNNFRAFEINSLPAVKKKISLVFKIEYSTISIVPKDINLLKISFTSPSPETTNFHEAFSSLIQPSEYQWSI